jgi:hypothetical protein
MKKTLTAMALLAGAVSVYSQGYISMNDYNGGGVGAEIQIFPAQSLAASTVDVSSAMGSNAPANSWKEQMGNANNSYLPTSLVGSTVYAVTKAGFGPGYDIGLLALGGGGASGYSQLSPVAGVLISTWQTSAGLAAGNNWGIWNTAAVAGIGPGNPTSASLAIAAWQATGSAGAATSLAQAQADGYGWGVSGIVTAALTVGTGSPGFLPTTLTSFSLAQGVPEPSTIALGVIGASTLLFRRRK